jgi:hypothetical protein
LDPVPNERPPVRSSTHRRRKRRRLLVRLAKHAAWLLIALSVILSIFVHKGLLGIAGLVGAVVVAVVMVHQRQWLWLDDEDDDVTEE